MSRRLKTDIHGPDWRRGIDDLRERGIPAAFAPELEPPLHLVVEIGFGRGEFLKDLAQRSPETAFLAIEASHKRMLKMARRLALGEFRNIRLVAARAEVVVEDILLPESVACFWINFPDPWPKKRHHRRRLIQPQLIGQGFDPPEDLDVPGGVKTLLSQGSGGLHQSDPFVISKGLGVNPNHPGCNADHIAGFIIELDLDHHAEGLLMDRNSLNCSNASGVRGSRN